MAEDYIENYDIVDRYLYYDGSAKEGGFYDKVIVMDPGNRTWRKILEASFQVDPSKLSTVHVNFIEALFKPVGLDLYYGILRKAPAFIEKINAFRYRTNVDRLQLFCFFLGNGMHPQYAGFLAIYHPNLREGDYSKDWFRQIDWLVKSALMLKSPLQNYEYFDVSTERSQSLRMSINRWRLTFPRKVFGYISDNEVIELFHGDDYL